MASEWRVVDQRDFPGLISEEGGPFQNFQKRPLTSSLLFSLFCSVCVFGPVGYFSFPGKSSPNWVALTDPRGGEIIFILTSHLKVPCT